MGTSAASVPCCCEKCPVGHRELTASTMPGRPRGVPVQSQWPVDLRACGPLPDLNPTCLLDPGLEPASRTAKVTLSCPTALSRGLLGQGELTAPRARCRPGPVPPPGPDALRSAPAASPAAGRRFSWCLCKAPPPRLSLSWESLSRACARVGTPPPLGQGVRGLLPRGSGSPAPASLLQRARDPVAPRKPRDYRHHTQQPCGLCAIPSPLPRAALLGLHGQQEVCHHSLALQTLHGGPCGFSCSHNGNAQFLCDRKLRPCPPCQFHNEDTGLRKRKKKFYCLASKGEDQGLLSWRL
ncbi:uncharacterized protein LOC124982641 [Sciurus carolinensis]|uniref:uncharacterized protein LOC124982641 n=1 Tax=Sciurus carolinensis TaxID=30640 RepID=UPI001FB2A066|nr:uncharacterized protein LOC124982641 [Sciurus carolinensis]XP_047405589.1 uncharacterized protein LOC124982641 [Sciurus carolinensis]